MQDIISIFISIVIIVALVKLVFEPIEKLYYKIRYRKPKNQIRYKEYYQYKDETTTPQYNTRKLLDNAEYEFYMFFKNECENKDMIALPKIKVEQFTNLAYTEHPADFIICDQEYNVIAGIELESNVPDTKAELVEKVFHIIKKPIFRINFQNNIYQEQTRDIINFLYEKYIFPM